MMNPAGRLGELVEDWLYFVRRYGWKSSSSLIFREMIFLLYRHSEFIILSRPLSKALPNLNLEMAINIRPFKSGDLDFVRRENRPSEAHLCRRRLQLGHYGVLATIEGRAAGYGWLCSDARLERFRFDLDPGDILFTDAFTDPIFRGKSVMTAISQARLQLAQKLGYQRIVGYIDIHNTPSLVVWKKKMGAEIIGRLDFRRIGPWRRARYF